MEIQHETEKGGGMHPSSTINNLGVNPSLSPFSLSLPQLPICMSSSREAVILLASSWPNMMSFLLESSIELITIGFAGSLGAAGTFHSSES